MSSHDQGDDELSELKALLQEIIDGGTPVTKSRISAVAECGLKNIQKFKKVVYQIERWIKHSEIPFRSAGVCVIDSLCTKARKTLGKEKDVFTPRFATRMMDTHAALKNIPRADKALLDRIFGEWKKRGWFDLPPLSDTPTTPAAAAAAAENKKPSSSSSKSQSKSSSSKDKKKHHQKASSSRGSRGRGAGLPPIDEGGENEDDDSGGGGGGLASPTYEEEDDDDNQKQEESSRANDQQQQQRQSSSSSSSSSKPVDPRRATDPRKRARQATAPSPDISTTSSTSAAAGSLTSPPPSASGGGPIDPRKRAKMAATSSSSSSSSSAAAASSSSSSSIPPKDPRSRRGGGGGKAKDPRSRKEGSQGGGGVGSLPPLQAFPSHPSYQTTGEEEEEEKSRNRSSTAAATGGPLRSPERKSSSKSKLGFFLGGEDEDEEEEDEELQLDNPEDAMMMDESGGGGAGAAGGDGGGIAPLPTLILSPRKTGPGIAETAGGSPTKTQPYQPRAAISAGWTGPGKDGVKRAHEVMENFYRTFEEGEPKWPDMTGLGERPSLSSSSSSAPPHATAVPEWGEEDWVGTPLNLMTPVPGFYLHHRKVKMTQAESKPIVDVTKCVPGRWGVGKVAAAAAAANTVK